MVPGTLLDELCLYVRLYSAVGPITLALLGRVILGPGRLIGLALTVTTAWFALNVLLAPYSAPMQQDLLALRYLFR